MCLRCFNRSGFLFFGKAHTKAQTCTCDPTSRLKSTNCILSHQISALVAFTLPLPSFPSTLPSYYLIERKRKRGERRRVESGFPPCPLCSNGNIMHILRRIKATGSNNRPFLCVCASLPACVRACDCEEVGEHHSPADG